MERGPMAAPNKNMPLDRKGLQAGRYVAWMRRAILVLCGETRRMLDCNGAPNCF